MCDEVVAPVECSAPAELEALIGNETPASRRSSVSSSVCLSEDSELDDDSRAGLTNSLRVEIPECHLLTPQCLYEPCDVGAPTMSEAQALATLASAAQKNADDFTEYRLDDFAVYCDTRAYPCEMRPLYHLDTKNALGDFYFSGILSNDGQDKVFVKRVPIAAMPIDNYGDLSKHTVQGHLWLESRLNRGAQIYYRLGRPAKEYARFFRPSLWVADLAKHFVDFLKVMGEKKRKVSIYQFRTTFCTWLRRIHKKAPAFLEWLEQYPRDDFRTSVVANIAFLHKEAVGVLEPKNVYFHTLWSEVWDFSRYKRQAAAAGLRTVVTQYTYDCFRHTLFADFLQVVPMSPETERLRNRLIRERHLEMPSALHDGAKDVSTTPGERIKNIEPGDTISTHRDGELSGTKWKREVAKGFEDIDRWFALVQSTHTDSRGGRVFDVIWYYRPVDTLCGLMKYPWNNELFLSDHCSCTEQYKIGEDEVLGVHDVEFGGTSATSAEFFCRQTYFHGERKWITLDAAHLRCEHAGGRTRAPDFVPGETLLVRVKTSSPISEPCELIASSEEGGKTEYRLRRLLRRREVDPEARAARPNELVYSDVELECKKHRIVGRCHVRFFPAGAEIATPYDRDGVGACFFLSHGQVTDEEGVPRCVPLEAAPATMRQGYDPATPMAKLRGLDLFCGGGNFGRGLEDGGGIEMKWANDYDSKAMHTYMANTESPEAVAAFLGSIDDLQRLAIQGKFARNVPAIGEVDFISGGSPCPGFSRLTNDKTTAQQRKNQSLVAAFGSFIDLYRPKYGLLENVPGIVHTRANRDQDVFSQLICAIVGLGYQTQFFFLDASSCGSAQRRSRVFLAFAAPGCRLPAKPPPTHSHPPNTRSLGLGMLPIGEPMAEREMPAATPFRFVHAEEAARDLPAIRDAKADVCIPFPDHRTSFGLTRVQRARILRIPKQPWGMNFALAWFGTGSRRRPGGGVLTALDRSYFAGDDEGGSAADAATKNRCGQTRIASNAYGRLYPNRLFETIVTTPNPGDGKNGRGLHWSEDRVLSVMEARRAQGVRDDEVLLGNPPTQYKIVGNSVAREVAVALGIVFREAWAASREAGGGDDDVQAGLAAEEPTTAAALVDDTSATSEPPAPGPWSSCGSPTPATTRPSTPASPPPSQTGCATAAASGQGQGQGKRRSSFRVEIRAAKRCCGGGLVGWSGNAVAEPSPLGQTVVTPHTES